MNGPTVDSHVSKLESLFDPPRPREVCDWRAVEQTLKSTLPRDFKDFWTKFGPGILGFRNTDPEFLVLHSPYVGSGYTRFPDCVAIMAENYRGLRTDFPQYHPHAVWPEKHGILGFGHDTNGNEYFFKTAESPDNWTIQSWGRHQDDRHFEVGFSEFLWEVAHNRILIADGFQGKAGDPGDAVWTPMDETG